MAGFSYSIRNINIGFIWKLWFKATPTDDGREYRSGVLADEYAVRWYAPSRLLPRHIRDFVVVPLEKDLPKAWPTSIHRHIVFSRLATSKNNQHRLDEDVESEDEEGPVGEVDEPLDSVTVRRRPVVRPHAAQHDPCEEVERHDAAVHGVEDGRTSPLQHGAE